MRTATASNIRAAGFAHVAFAAALLLAAVPAGAQDLSTNAIRPAPMKVVSREVAKYRFNGVRNEGLPAEVTVIDRGGELLATYRLPGQRVAEPMMVTILDADIILQAETEKGVLTLQLFKQNDEPGANALVGRWTLGSRSGELRGRAK
jgi:hypothetical protein